MNTNLYWDIFKAFLGPSSLTFGDGPASIGLMQQVVVEKYQWLTMQEFTDALALGNSLPGPIATKMSALFNRIQSRWKDWCPSWNNFNSIPLTSYM